MDLTIEKVEIGTLHLDPANARVHMEKNMDAISNSLKEFGQVEPLVVQASTGKVIGGNGRLEAMKKLGWTEVDIVRVDVDDMKSIALGITLNRTGDLSWFDEEALSKLVEGLKNTDFDVNAMGWDEDELKNIIPPMGAGSKYGG